MNYLIDLLSDPVKIQNVLQSVSSYVIYIYPGIITIYWNNFLQAKSTRDTQALVIKSFSISYLYNIMLDAILLCDVSVVTYNVLLLAISILFPFIYCKIKYSKFLVCICEKLGIRTCIISIPFELLKTSEEKYTCLKVYLKDSNFVYIGYMERYEYEEDKERFITLVGYKKYIYKNGKEKLVVDNKAERYDQKVLIKYNEIKVIEKIAEDIAANEIYG